MSKHYKTLYTTFLFIFTLLSNSYSQESGIVNYELTKSISNPRFISGYINLLSTSIEKYNFSFNTTIGAKAMYDRFFLDAGYKYDYVDGMAEHVFHTASSSNGISTTNDQNSRNGFVTIGFGVINKTRKKEISVNIKHSDISGRNVKHAKTFYVVNVDGKENHKLNMEIGYTNGFTWYSLHDVDVLSKNLSTGQESSFNGGDLYTFMDYSWVNIGASISNFTNTEIKLTNGETRANRSYDRIYGAILISTKMNFEDILIKETNPISYEEYYEQHTINNYIKKSPIGFRIGYSIHTMDKLDWGYTVETGFIPGTGGIVHNAYLSISARLTISKMFN
jgi:hypothetical protein